MEAKRSKLKRKSPSAAIFELNDDDLSSENSEIEIEGPDSKIQKISGDTSENKSLNLECDNSASDENNVEKNEGGLEEKQQGCVVKQNTTVTIEINEEATTKNEVEIVLRPSGQKTHSEDAATTLEITSKSVIDLTSPDGQINTEEGEIHEEIDGAQPLNDSSDFIKSVPCVSIKFKDKEMADIYRPKFLKFVQSFVELQVEDVRDETTINLTRDTTLNPSDWVVLDDTICLEVDEELAQELPKTTPKKKKNKKKNKKAKELFVVDTTPCTESIKINLETKYSAKFSIDEKKEETPSAAIKKPNLSSVCFNCGSEHNLKDCPVPKNHAKIAAARKEFSTNRYKTSRYHMEDDQKYSHLAPGRISANLRKALGLKKHQLPPYLYQMRLLGYPPGWLEEAKFVSSNLSLFDIDGNDVDVKTVADRGLDPLKVVDYPGFNVPLEQGFKDEYKYYDVPPYSNNFGKERMVEFFKKLEKSKEDDMETCDMDLDQSSQSVVDVMEIKMKRVVELKEIASNAPSPSLKELEKEKEELLAQLDTNTDSSQRSETENEDSQENYSPKNSVKMAINSSFGTPILKSSSPYSRLPNADNFSKDVSPVINFENLPNSTGKYEQMTGLLQKVRDTLRHQGAKT